MAEKQAQAAAQTETTTQAGLLDQIVDGARVGKDASQRERSKDFIKQFVSEVLEGTITVAKDTESMINARIGQIDHLISIQLNEVIHHPEFQKLEASWRGLKYLISNSELTDNLKIRVLNVSKRISCAICSARRNSTRARSSRRSMKRSTASLVARPLPR